MKSSSKKNQAGFTLIELAIIIAVLAILGAVGAMKLTSLTTEAERSGAYSAMANARSALAAALAKDSNGQVTYAELKTNLEGASAAADDTTHTFTLDKYTITYEGAQGTSIISISSASITP